MFYWFHSRDMLPVAVEMLQAAQHIQLTGEALPVGPDGTRMRSETMESDYFLKEEKNARRLHGASAYLLGVHLFLDEALVSWSGAHYMFPRRARVVNVKDGVGMWVTVGYLSHVPKTVVRTEAARFDDK